MALSPDLLCHATCKFPLDDISDTTFFTDIPTYIYLIKMDSLLTNKDALAAQASEELKVELDEQNIGGRYNALMMIDFFKGVQRCNCKTN